MNEVVAQAFLLTFWQLQLHINPILVALTAPQFVSLWCSGKRSSLDFRVSTYLSLWCSYIHVLVKRIAPTRVADISERKKRHELTWPSFNGPTRAWSSRGFHEKKVTSRFVRFLGHFRYRKPAYLAPTVEANHWDGGTVLRLTVDNGRNGSVGVCPCIR